MVVGVLILSFGYRYGIVRGRDPMLLDGKSVADDILAALMLTGSCEGSLPRSKLANSIVSIDRARVFAGAWWRSSHKLNRRNTFLHKKMLANYDLSSRWCEPCRFAPPNLVSDFGAVRAHVIVMRSCSSKFQSDPIRSTLAIRYVGLVRYGERADEEGRRDEVVRLAFLCRSGTCNESANIGPGFYSASLLSFSISSTSSAGGALRCSSRSSHSNNQQQRLLAVAAAGLRFWTIPRGQTRLR